MAKLSRRRVAREVVRMVAEQPKRQAEIVRWVAAYLIDTKQTRQADLLLQDIADELFAQQGHLSAQADSMFELNQSTKNVIISLLREATGATSVDLDSHINPTLLGGVVVRTPRQELDASVRRKLNLIGYGLGETT